MHKCRKKENQFKTYEKLCQQNKKNIKTRYNCIIIKRLLNMFETVSTRYFLAGHQTVLRIQLNHRSFSVLINIIYLAIGFLKLKSMGIVQFLIP